MDTHTSSEPRRTTWDDAVLLCLRARSAPTPLSMLYGAVRTAAPELVECNPHWTDKVRQVVQRLGRKGLAVHVRKGVWAAKRD